MPRMLARLLAIILFLLPMFNGIATLARAQTSPSVPSGTTPTSSSLTGTVTRIGTHLIQGDEGLQGEVLAKLASKISALPASNPLRNNYPIVLMTYANNFSVPNFPSGFKPIIRLNITCDTTPGQMAAAAARLAGNTHPIVIGNEINNRSLEWCFEEEVKKISDEEAYKRYAVLFNAFANAYGGSGPLGISAMDPLNGDYDADKALEIIFTKTEINTSKITAVFANAYEADPLSCENSGYELVRCSAESGNWVVSRINELAGKSFSASSDLYITEFGIITCQKPGAEMDWDCQQAFYEKHDKTIQAALVVGFARYENGGGWIHPVPAVCEYWNLGTLAENFPTTCGSKKTQENAVYVYPGVEEQTDPKKQLEMLSKYKLLCAPQMKLNVKIEEDDYIDVPMGPVDGGYWDPKEKPGVFCPSGAKNPSPYCFIPSNNKSGNVIPAGVLFDDRGTKIPLYRDDKVEIPNTTSPDRRVNDLEGYFGAAFTGKGKTLTEKETLIAPLANGVSLKLSGYADQCQNTKKFLSAVQNLCNDPGMVKINDNPKNARAVKDANDKPPLTGFACPLDVSIPKTSYTYRSLASTMTNLDCGKYDTFPTEVKTALANVETTLPRGYKPAYIIHASMLPVTPGPANLNYIANWFSPESVGTQQTLVDRITIQKVLVPAGFAEDASGTDEFVPHRFDGVFTQTAKSLTSLSTQERILEEKILEEKKIFSYVWDESTNSPKYGMEAPKTRGKPDARYLFCPECGGNDLNAQIARRINAELQIHLLKNNSLPIEKNCAFESHIGENAKTINAKINPPGYDPVYKAEMKVKTIINLAGTPNLDLKNIYPGSAMIPGGDSSKFPEETWSAADYRTYILLPEEYGNVTDYEQEILDAFVPFGDPLHNPENFQKTKGQQDKLGFKYLQMSGSKVTLTNNPATPADQSYGDLITIDTTYNADPDLNCSNATLGGPAHCVRRTPITLTGQIIFNGEEKPNTNPLVPGGVLARTLWEIACNITRPYDGYQTKDYPGFETFLKLGLNACRGQKYSPLVDDDTPNTNVCSGKTTVPTGKNWEAFYSIFKSASAKVAQKRGRTIPPEYLYGIFRIEGTPTYNAFYFDKGSAECKPNSVGAVGPMQIMTKACGAGYAVWEENISRLGMSDASPCNLEDALMVAAEIFLRNYSKFSSGGTVDWRGLLCTYNGINNSCPQNVQGCVSDTNPKGDYGTCAIEFSRKFGIPQN